NVIAAAASARKRVRDIECDVDLGARGMVPARSFDGLLFVAGLTDARMADILGKARKIFAAAGSRLENAVRVLQFHANLAECSDIGLPFSAIEAGGTSLIVDFWGSV